MKDHYTTIFSGLFRNTCFAIAICIFRTQITEQLLCHTIRVVVNECHVKVKGQCHITGRRQKRICCKNTKQFMQVKIITLCTCNGAVARRVSMCVNTIMSVTSRVMKACRVGRDYVHIKYVIIIVVVTTSRRSIDKGQQFAMKCVARLHNSCTHGSINR